LLRELIVSMKTVRDTFHAVTLAVVLAAAAHISSPIRAANDCNRECLRGFITRYLDAMVTHTPGALPVAPTIRFTEDYVDLKLGEGLWKQASKIRPYRLDLLGSAPGVAWYLIPIQPWHSLVPL